MPIVTFSSIYSFSSEDPLWPASNLVAKPPKKWRCKIGGEKKASVCFKLDKPSIITAVDIGNNYSAYVSVLVGRNGARDEDFKEILFASTMMSSADVRKATNVNGVKCFFKEALIESIANQKWDLVKVVCTQPYSNRVQYGLSMVKVHVLPDEGHAKAKPLVPTSFMAASNTTLSPSPFAKFKLRADSTESESDTSSSLFNRWKQSKAQDTGSVAGCSAAASIRDAAASPANQGPSNKPTFTPKPSKTPIPTSSAASKQNDEESPPDELKPKRVDRNRMALMYDSDDEKPNEKLDKKLNHDLAKRKESEAKDTKTKSRTAERTSEKFKDFLDDKPVATADVLKPSPALVNKVADSSVTPNGKAKTAPVTPNGKATRYSPVASSSTRKRPLSPVATSSKYSPLKKIKTIPAKEITYKPFGKLLEGVVLVISGIQNPERGHIRDKALKMGAKYKSDWDSGCTHLICAFKNTPKYNQVHGSGKIIKKDWIGACYDLKKRIPWRRFALDSDEKKHPESEDEIEDISMKPKESAPMKPSIVIDKGSATIDDDETDCDEVAETDTEPECNPVRSTFRRTPSKNAILSSGSDTEDEIERVVKRKAEREMPKPPSKDEIFDQTTDEEMKPKSSGISLGNRRSVTPLPEFFKNKVFYISSNVSSVDTIKLNRFIGVYSGKTTTNAAEAHYVLSNKAKQLPADFEGEVVKPLWVFECNDLECLLPTTRYRF